jgi:subtilase family serine protease
VRNTGSRTARDVMVRLTDGRKRVGRTTLTRLRPGVTTAVRFTWHATKGRHRFIGYVDPHNRIPESDEGDNERVTRMST